MKFLAQFITAIILLLAIKPAADALVLPAGTDRDCCSHENGDPNETESPGEDRDCAGKTCNPFQSCDYCVAVCPDVTLDRIPKPAPHFKKVYAAISVFHSQYLTDFWQPPKIV